MRENIFYMYSTCLHIFHVLKGYSGYFPVHDNLISTKHICGNTSITKRVIVDSSNN